MSVCQAGRNQLAGFDGDLVCEFGLVREIAMEIKGGFAVENEWVVVSRTAD